MIGGNDFRVERFASVSEYLEKSAISIFYAGCIDLKVVKFNDIEGSLFWFVGVAMVYGAKSSKKWLKIRSLVCIYIFWDNYFSETARAFSDCLVTLKLTLWWKFWIIT